MQLKYTIIQSLNDTVLNSIRIDIKSKHIAMFLQDDTFNNIYDYMYEQLALFITNYDIRSNALQVNLYIDNCYISDNR